MAETGRGPSAGAQYQAEPHGKRAGGRRWHSPSQEAEPVLVSSTVAPAPEAECESEEVPLPPCQYSGEAQLMAAILDWQRNLPGTGGRQSGNQCPPAGSDSNHMAKLVVARLWGSSPSRAQEDRQAETAPAWKQNLCSRPQWRQPARTGRSRCTPHLPPPHQLPAPTLPLPGD